MIKLKLAYNSVPTLSELFRTNIYKTLKQIQGDEQVVKQKLFSSAESTFSKMTIIV